MASRSSLSRSRSDGKKTLLPSNSEKEMDVGNVAAGASGEASIKQVIEGLSLSKRLVRSVSQKLKKKHKGGEEEEEGGSERRISSGCLCLYAKGGGCKVGADTTDELGDGNYGRRKSSAGEECMGYRSIPGLEESRLDCFSYGVAERLWWKNNRKAKEIGQGAPSESPPQFSLPDEVIEMCLARVPLTTIMNARLVCKTWRALTMSPHFMQIRQEGSYQTPWLFVFGIVKDEFCDGQIHALDVSLDQWHRIGVVDMLKGRFLFSVTSVGNEIYVVGGCTSLSNFGKVDKSSFKTHKSVVVFSPLTGSSRLVASMKLARSAPILGVFELGSCSLTFQTWQSCQDQRFPRPRVRGVSDVYEDPHMFSLRRQLRDAFHESDSSLEVRRKSFKLVKQDKKQHDDKNCRRFVLIAVGGKGSRDENLDTAEIYDPVSNKWSEIARLPGDFGVVCSGVVCNGKFYVTSETNKLAAYDLERGVWIGIEIAHSPPRLYEYPPRLVSCNDHLFMLCVVWCERGEEVRRTLQAVRKMWELDLSLLSWSEVSRHPDAPMDRNAVFVADRGKIFGVEMFKIFGQVIDFHTVCDVSKSSEMKWSRISGKHVAHEFDASSCKTKSMVVLHL